MPTCGPRRTGGSTARCSTGCGNPVLLESFDRLWTASELTRHWSGIVDPARDPVGEHAALEEAALSRDADRAAELLARHVRHTAEVLRD